MMSDSAHHLRTGLLPCSAKTSAIFTATANAHVRRSVRGRHFRLPNSAPRSIVALWMTARTATACFVLGLASCAAGQGTPEKALPRIASPEALAIDMAKALVSGDRQRFTALAATREEMEGMLETAWRPTTPEDRQYVKDKVAEILADRGEDYDRFQAMKHKADVKEGAAVRFELIDLDPVREKDGMKKVRHSRVRMFQATGAGREEAFLIKLDDMFLFQRGWAFTSVWPAIAKESDLPRP